MRGGRISYRSATVDDVAALADLRAAFTYEDPAENASPRADFREEFDSIVSEGIESGRWTVWVAEADGEIVAHAFVGRIAKIPRPIREPRSIGYLTNVYTSPAHRGRGVGTALLERLLEWARSEDVELLVVWPSEESVEFYERLGFAAGRDPLVWERRLE